MAKTATEEERTHSTERLIAFSDGIVAVAITVLVLPLTDIELPESEHANPLSYVWNEYGQIIISFTVTWFVIFAFWSAHHRSWGSYRRATSFMVRCNMFWLLGIVVLPFPTNLIGQVHSNTDGHQGLVAFYIGVMFMISLMMLLVHLDAQNRPELYENEQKWDASHTSRPLIFTAYLGICTIAAIFIGYYATWALLGLFAMGWLTDAVDKRAKPVELKERPAHWDEPTVDANNE